MRASGLGPRLPGLACICAALIFFPTSSSLANQTAEPISDALWQGALLEFHFMLKDKVKTGEITEAQYQLAASRRIPFVFRAVQSKLTNPVWGEGSFYPEYEDDDHIQSARKFMKERDAALSRAEGTYGVPKEVVTALLLIETEFGWYPPKYNALDVYVALASLRIPWFRERVVAAIEDWVGEREDWVQRTREKNIIWEERARETGVFYFQQLLSFLVVADRLQWDLEEKRSSWAGALGYGQFLAGTALGILRDDQGVVEDCDLWDWDDTIELVARELAGKGWKKDLSRKEQQAVLETYNHSPLYAAEALEVRDILIKPPKRKKEFATSETGR